MTAFIQLIEGLSLIICGALVLFTLRRKGKNRLLRLLGWLFIAGGLFRLSNSLSSWFLGVSSNVWPALVVSIVTTSCLYVGIAGYLQMQFGFLGGERAGRVSLIVGMALAAALTLFHTAASGFLFISAPLTARLAELWPSVMLSVMGVYALVMGVFVLFFIALARRSEAPMVSNSVMNVGLGLLLVAWILQKITQVLVSSPTSVMLSALPFVAIAIVIVAVFLQTSVAMTAGQVYDAATKQPLALALVRVFRAKDQKLLESRVTSPEGRYGFLVEPGTYTLNVTAPGYHFPTAQQIGYRGDTVTIKKPTMVGFDIFLDPPSSAT